MVGRFYFLRNPIPKIAQKQCQFVSFEKKKKIEGTLASAVGAAAGDIGDMGDSMVGASGLSGDLVAGTVGDGIGDNVVMDEGDNVGGGCCCGRR